MDLRQASTYFITDTIDGWNGTAWVPAVTKGDLLPFDRFIADRDYVGLGRNLLLDPEDTALDLYSVIRLVSGDIYLVGNQNFDIQNGVYSRVISVYRTQHQATLLGFVKTYSASGVAGAITRGNLGAYHCSIERVTFGASKEFDHTRLTESLISLPRECPVKTDNELQVGTDFYNVLEVFDFQGFVRARATKKKST
jgi:hypothetical protein